MADKRLTQLLSELVAIPSVNPEDTKDTALVGELRLAEFIAAYLEGRGFDVEWHERETGRPNVLASYGPPRASKTVFLTSHLDTVGVEGMKRPPFEAQVEDGRLYGRGACDTKGPMAAALHAFTPDLLQALDESDIRLVFGGLMGEEKGNIGAEKLVKTGFHADHALILEPTELGIVHAHKGALWFRLETRGKAGHGSNPALGVNAIIAMTDVLRHLLDENTAEQKRSRNELLGGPTLNVGSIEGGAAVNIVADRCVVEVDRRVLPEEDGPEIIERLRRFMDQMQKRGAITGYDIHIMKFGSPFETSADSELVRTLKQSCEQTGVTPKTEGAAWYSDAGPLAKVCPEVCVFGPGSIRQAHTDEEFIDLEELAVGSKILRQFLQNLADNTCKFVPGN